MLFFASAFEIDALILVAGGLVSIIVGPIWWLWLGLTFWRTAALRPAEAAPSS